MSIKNINTLFIILNLFFLLSITTFCKQSDNNKSVSTEKEVKKATTTPVEKTTTDEVEAAPKTNPAPKKKLIKTKTGKEVLKAEKGITIVNPDGWTTNQMDFQIGYCEQMMGNLEDIDGTTFCECFLDKIQYYYKPIYVRDAYDDQQKWNQQCYEEALK